MPKLLSVSYLPTTDTVIIDGVEYPGALFRAITSAEPGQRFQIRKRRQGNRVVCAEETRRGKNEGSGE